MNHRPVHQPGRARQAGPDPERSTFQVEPVPPFRLDLTVHALRRWLGLLEPLDHDGARRVLARWQPFQGLACLHRLL